jgi:tetratricopeptide (TPR) repeat protein
MPHPLEQLMKYPGNPSLAEEARRKILDTYGQTLDLAAQGKREEALLGCDFVLRLDSEFEPADILQQRVEAAAGAVAVDDLAEDLARMLAVDSPPAAPEPVAEDRSPAEAPAGETSTTPEAVLGDVEEAPVTFAAEEPVSADLPSSTLSDEADLLDSALDFGALDDDAAATATTGPETSTPEPSEGGAGAGASAPVIEPTAALDKESEERIVELIADGQAAFDEGEYQSAIDAWSRIFLIDIEHPEANRLIDLARKLKAEVERKLEEKYHDALSKLESGKVDDARAAFAQVLELQPGHIAAREYLDRLGAGEFTGKKVETPDLAAEPDLAVLEPPPFAAEDLGDEDLADGDLAAEDFEFPEEVFEPVEPVAEPIPAARPRSSRRALIVIAGLVLAVVLAAAWMLWDNWDRAFPSADEEPAAEPIARVDPIDRATALYVEGQRAMAIAQLRRLPPAHPQHSEAQALIAQWEAAEEKQPGADLPAEVVAERDQFVARAREAFANREFLEAEALFDLARQSAPLDEGAAALAAETSNRLDPLRAEIDIFRQGEWTHALRSLWGKHEEDPTNRDIVRLMVDSYYNLAVRDLQRGDPGAALANLEEARALADGNGEIERLIEFASTYRQRNQDLLYRIFVKYLPFR